MATTSGPSPQRLQGGVSTRAPHDGSKMAATIGASNWSPSGAVWSGAGGSECGEGLVRRVVLY